MKKIKYLQRTVLFMVIAFVVINRAPSYINNFNQQGLKVETTEVMSIKDNTKINFPSSPAILIFWATWCAPCKVEMSRLKTSVLKGKIPSDKIFAINPFESIFDVKRFLAKNDFPFTFIDDSGLSGHFNVSLTPTTLLLKDNRVVSMSSGPSFIGIWRAEWLFQ